MFLIPRKCTQNLLPSYALDSQYSVVWSARQCSAGVMHNRSMVSRPSVGREAYGIFCPNKYYRVSPDTKLLCNCCYSLCTGYGMIAGLYVYK